MHHKCNAWCKATDKNPNKYDYLIFEGTKYYQCPLKSIDAEINYLIYAYNFFEKGFLPNEGGWADQSNKYIEAMNFINQECLDMQREELKSLNKSQRRR